MYNIITQCICVVYLPIAALVIRPFLVPQQLLLSGHVCGVRKDSGASGYMYVWDLVPLHIYLKMVVVEENGLGYHKRRRVCLRAVFFF